MGPGWCRRAPTTTSRRCSWTTTVGRSVVRRCPEIRQRQQRPCGRSINPRCRTRPGRAVRTAGQGPGAWWFARPFPSNPPNWNSSRHCCSGHPQIWFQDPLSGLNVKPSDVPGGCVGYINVVLSTIRASPTAFAHVGDHAVRLVQPDHHGRRSGRLGGHGQARRRGSSPTIRSSTSSGQRPRLTARRRGSQKLAREAAEEKLPADARVVLLKRTATTNAGKKVACLGERQGQALMDPKQGERRRPSPRKVKITTRPRRHPSTPPFKKRFEIRWVLIGCCSGRREDRGSVARGVARWQPLSWAWG